MNSSYYNLINEGGEGYVARAVEAATVVARTEDAIIRDIERITCEAGRGIDGGGLKAELAAVRATKSAAFAAEWTAEATAARRADWNAWVRTLGRKVTANQVAARVAAQGWNTADLKKAVAMHA